MLGIIEEIRGNHVILNKSDTITNNILNKYVKINDDKAIYIGEIEGINKKQIFINLLGEIKNNRFVYGINNKPNIDSKVELITDIETKILFSSNCITSKGNLYLGKSAVYENVNVFANINHLFSNHYAILGNTGSGKSCAMARILQNLFYKKDASPLNATFIIIDAFGEYKPAFRLINTINKELQCKSYAANANNEDNLIKIPIWLLSLDDICLLLGVRNTSQIPIVEKALKLVNVFLQKDEKSEKVQNSIIASSLLDIFINGKSPAQIRDQVFSVLTRYNTPSLNLDTQIYVPGYSRPLKQCMIIDETGKIREMQLVIEFLQTYVINDIDLKLPDGSYIYTLKDLLYVFDFALIDEGLLNNADIYSLAHELRVHLSNIIEGPYSKFFNFDRYYDKKDFITDFISNNHKKAQVINININNIDDRFAKVISKIYSKLLFDYAKNDIIRTSMPIHIVLEEAHRYVQNDSDKLILGYNIFERIAKEGRKYGVLLNLISQRPSELSQTVLSQCNNFITFKISHPVDIEFIKEVIPNTNEEIIEKIKSLQTGTCLIFGNAVNLPYLIKVDMAYPSPENSSVNIENIWF